LTGCGDRFVVFIEDPPGQTGRPIFRVGHAEAGQVVRFYGRHLKPESTNSEIEEDPGEIEINFEEGWWPFEEPQSTITISPGPERGQEFKVSSGIENGTVFKFTVTEAGNSVEREYYLAVDSGLALVPNRLSYIFGFRDSKYKFCLMSLFCKVVGVAGVTVVNRFGGGALFEVLDAKDDQWEKNSSWEEKVLTNETSVDLPFKESVRREGTCICWIKGVARTEGPVEGGGTEHVAIIIDPGTIGSGDYSYPLDWFPGAEPP
jgi:hypothetical protein